MVARPVVPKAIRRLEDRIEFEWSADHTSVLPARALRLACPCARCVDEISGRPLLDPESVPTDVRAESIAPVGAYGIRIGWSDGHATGIYTYAMLLEQCTCPRCAAGG